MTDINQNNPNRRGRPFGAKNKIQNAEAEMFYAALRLLNQGKTPEETAIPFVMRAALLDPIKFCQMIARRIPIAQELKVSGELDTTVTIKQMTVEDFKKLIEDMKKEKE